MAIVVSLEGLDAVLPFSGNGIHARFLKIFSHHDISKENLLSQNNFEPRISPIASRRSGWL